MAPGGQFSALLMVKVKEMITTTAPSVDAQCPSKNLTRAIALSEGRLVCNAKNRFVGQKLLMSRSNGIHVGGKERSREEDQCM